jgi:hypothetical protein
VAGAGSVAIVARVAQGGGLRETLALVALSGVGLAVLAGLVFTSLGVLLATRLSPALAATATCGVAVLGAASDLALYTITESLYQPAPSASLHYMATVATCTLLVSAGALALAAVLLEGRDLG